MPKTDYKPFGACLSDLLARRNLTAASVSRMLGHKSRTTLRRILQDQANLESMERFLDELKAAQPFALTDSERRELEQALEISRIGLTGFLSRKLLSELIYTTASVPEALLIERHDDLPERSISPEQFFRELSGAVRLDILMINNIPSAISEALARFLKNAHPANIEIEHYFFLNDNTARTVQFIASVLPSLKFPCFTPYAIPLSSSIQSGGSILACRAHLADGSTQEYQLGSSEPSTGHLVTAKSGIYHFWSGMLAPAKPLRLPVKLSVGISGDSLDSYLRMAEAYLGLEQNCAIYMLKPTLCLSMIEPGLLECAIRDGIQNTAFCDDPAIETFHRQLTDVQHRRFDNMYHKKRVTHVLLSYESMKRFVRTGRLTDHFFGLRPFTVRERREILIHCRNQSHDNPYFNIYFLKNDSEPIRLEATCYESHGVLIHASATDYCLSGEHADALITLEDFTTLFCQYFRETLLPQNAHSLGTSLSILSALIDELPEG